MSLEFVHYVETERNVGRRGGEENLFGVEAPDRTASLTKMCGSPFYCRKVAFDESSIYRSPSQVCAELDGERFADMSVVPSFQKSLVIVEKCIERHFVESLQTSDLSGVHCRDGKITDVHLLVELTHQERRRSHRDPLSLSLFSCLHSPLSSIESFLTSQVFGPFPGY